VVVVVLTVSFLFYHYRNNKTQIAQNTSSATQTMSKQKKAAIVKMQAEVNSAKTSLQKANAYEALGEAYFNSTNYSGAIQADKDALDSDSSVKIEALGALAYTYATDGQRAQAISTYQELVSLLQQQGQSSQTNPYINAETPMQSDQQAIQTLQKGGNL
jgi:tetratricopeptide (TPR) repeat protein